MNTQEVQLFCGTGDGKTSAAIGKAIIAASQGKQVIIIQFLKSKNVEELEFFKKLEPQIKLFRFEKLADSFETLNDEQRQEEIMNIKNGINFARKVMVTHSCDLVVLDELLGLIDNEILSIEELTEILEAKADGMQVIITGIKCPDDIVKYADKISKIE